MILTCPECATRYFVDEAKLGPQGRRVRCASCGACWRAEPEAETLNLASESSAAPAPEAAPPPRPAEALSQSFRAQAQARKRARQAAAAGAVWAGLAAGFAVLALCAVVFRVQVVRLLPRAAGAYAALRLPVNPLGLAPEAVQATPGLQDGHAMLFVKGVERNVEAIPRAPAALRISLYDKAGVRLASQIAAIGGAPLPPGEGRAFQAAFVDPPLAGVQVGVDLVFPNRRPVARAAAGTAPPGPRLRGPTPAAPLPVAPIRLAEPLPAASPYALPAAARPQAPMPSG